MAAKKEMKGSVISGEPAMAKKVTKSNKDRVLNLSDKGLQNMTSLPKHYSTVCDLILDNNSIAKIEKLDAYAKLCSLSMVNNHLVRMNGVNFAKNLISVNLSNNGITSMEGLCWLVHLEYLDLSKNNIKRIQNVSYCTKLKHMDLSENSITDISNLKSLVQLKVLLLHGNTITMLERAKENLPEQVETFSLSENGISDLNELRHLSCLLILKHFSILNNPCVTRTASLPGFDFRPFILFCLPSLITLDHGVVTDSERQEGERLSKDDSLFLFSFGHHLQLVLYLSKMYPLNNTVKVNKDQNDLVQSFLEKRRVEMSAELKSSEVRTSPFSQNNDSYHRGVRRPTDSLQSSSYSVLPFSEDAQNGSGNFSPDEDSEADTLRSESRFLPVYSPLKKSPRFDHGKSWESSPPNNTEDLSIITNDASNVAEELPIMTEEEANKLINLAATILQSHIRGFLARRKFHFKTFKKTHTAASKIQALWRGYYFRRYSYQGLNLKNEIRVRRLQKYISTLCLLMQKSEKQRTVEKQQMLEIISLLYEKVTHLSDKVERLECSANARNNLERNVHPVFLPHPLLSRNIEEHLGIINAPREIAGNSLGFPLLNDVGYHVEMDEDAGDVIVLSGEGDSSDNAISDDVMEFPGAGLVVDHLDREVAKEERCRLVDKEGYAVVTEWDMKEHKDGDNKEDEDENNEEDYPRLAECDKEYRTSEDGMDDSEIERDEDDYSKDGAKWNGKEEGTNEDSCVHEEPELPCDHLSSNTIMTSEISVDSRFSGNTREISLQNNKKDLSEGEALFMDNNTKDYLTSPDVSAEDFSLCRSQNVYEKDCQVNESNVGEQFDYEKQSCSDFEDYQESKSDTTTGEDDEVQIEKNQVEDNIEISNQEPSNINHTSEILHQITREELTENTDHKLSAELLNICSEVTDQPAVSSDVTNKAYSRVRDHDSRPVEVATVVESQNGKDEVSSSDEGEHCEKGQEDIHGGNSSIDSSRQDIDRGEHFDENKEVCSTHEVKFRDIKEKSNSGADGGGYVNDVHGTLEASGQLTVCVAEETRVELDEELELANPVDNQGTDLDGIREETFDASAGIKVESYKESIEGIHESPEDGRVVDVSKDRDGHTSLDGITFSDKVDLLPAVEDSGSAMVNVVMDSHGGRQNVDLESPNITKIDSSSKEESCTDEGLSFGNVEQETVTEDTSKTEVKKISPRLGKRASSLLSALKDEITGVSSKDVHVEEPSSHSPVCPTTEGGVSSKDAEEPSSHSPVCPTTEGEVEHSRDVTVESSARNDIPTFRSDEITDVYDV